jgi:hypothetical protein
VGEDLDDRWRGRVFSELPDDLKKRFRRYNLVVRQLPELSDQLLREIFRRLNKTVEALEPQELRHAAYLGPFLQLVERSAVQEVLEDIGVFSPKDYLRRRSDEFMAEVAYAVYAGAFPNKKDGLDELFLTFEKQGSEAQLANLVWRFGRVFEQLTLESSAIRRTRFRNKSDFYSLFVFLARNAEHLPLEGSSSEFVGAVRNLSQLVNAIKRSEGGEMRSEDVEQVMAQPVAPLAQRYLRSVERAASDRLNRVRRDEVLEGVLGELVRNSTFRPLDSEDGSWFAGSGSEHDFEEVEREIEELEMEKGHVQEVLLLAEDQFLPDK